MLHFKFCCNFIKSMFCRFLAMSTLLSAMTTGIFNSNICVVKNKLLSKLLESTTFIITSGLVFFINSVVTLSSSVYGFIEYAPGKSIICMSFLLHLFFHLQSILV